MLSYVRLPDKGCSKKTVQERQGAEMTARFRETGQGSFWGDYVYEQVVPKNHFLRKLANLIDGLEEAQMRASKECWR